MMNFNSINQVIHIDEKKYPNWKSFLKEEFRRFQSKKLKIDCGNLFLSCKDILSIIEMSNKYNCEIKNFISTFPETIVCLQSLGYGFQLAIDNFSNNSRDANCKNSGFSSTSFHQGTVRSGEYITSSGDLLILGDVNPGGMVSAVGNIMVWGRLFGTAHAGNQGDSEAKISALQLCPIQLRIANKVARGPKEKPQPGLAEQAKIESENIIISSLETI
tara:strand:- start:212 stop:862 length:651 start_codon:yes stop_codon:yes gene_type:complete